MAAEKGDGETEPSKRLKWLYEEQGQSGGLLVSTSDPIPSKDTDQPLHREAAAYYKRIAKDIGGSYVVTMEHPTQGKPKPLVMVRKSAGGSGTILSISSSNPSSHRIASFQFSTASRSGSAFITRTVAPRRSSR